MIDNVRLSDDDQDVMLAYSDDGTFHSESADALLLEGDAVYLLRGGKPRRFGVRQGDKLVLGRSLLGVAETDKVVVKAKHTPGAPLLALDATSGALVARDGHGFQLLYSRRYPALAGALGRTAYSSFVGTAWEYGSALQTPRVVVAEASYFADHPRNLPSAEELDFLASVRGRVSVLAERSV